MEGWGAPMFHHPCSVNALRGSEGAAFDLPTDNETGNHWLTSRIIELT